MESTKKNVINYHTIITHQSPHPDEYLAIIFLREFGEEKYPGIGESKVEFWDAGVKTPDGKSWQDWHNRGYLLVGVGGSCFDEHLTNGRVKGECAASLVAKDLEIDKASYTKKVLDYVVSNDLNGGNNPNDIAAVIRLANEQWFEREPQKTLEFCIQLLQLRLFDQMDFHITAKAEFEGRYTSVETVQHLGKEIKVMFSESDHIKLGAYARSEFGGKVDVVVIKNSKGNVIIVTNKHPVDLSNVIRGLRGCEAAIKKLEIPGHLLALEGTLEQLAEWHYNKDANQIFNGSKSAPNVPASQIKFNKLKAIITERLERTVSKPADRPAFNSKAVHQS